ncbi:magnesium-transporting ATPase MgtA [Yersinia frederiksenii]|nr:magnesium-transporting ATPase MgtA [Yersinia frederiksenii]
MQVKNFTRQLLNVLSRNLPRRLIRRETMLDGVTTGVTAKDIPADLARQRLLCANETPQQLYQRFQSHPEGLTEQEAETIRQRSGSNLIENQQAVSGWIHLWHCYRNPFNLLLTILALISYATEDLTAALVIGAMVLISTLMHFIQEARSNRAADA